MADIVDASTVQYCNVRIQMRTAAPRQITWWWRGAAYAPRGRTWPNTFQTFQLRPSRIRSKVFLL